MKRVIITCDLCEGPIVDYVQAESESEYKTYKLLSDDVCEECIGKILPKLTEYVLSLKPKKEDR